MNGIQFDKARATVEAIKANPELKMRKWHADVSWKGGVKNEIKIRDFAPYLTDEPEALGGTDQAANPVEYLIGAAVSCFIITFEVMASQAGVKLEEVKAEIDADLNAAVFLGLEEGDGGILNPIIKLNAKTSASPEEVKQIAKTALGKSPVLSSLKDPVQLIVE
ncbi:OsmC family protein [Bacillus aquiflavi]|uniref:OsmC family protein n=1 Tax=Bacillus aquiflavi TaxID=2672567 RepID=UPI001CA86CEE|nr:OsmC family protein [Bacillus aquiflavi]UAC48444.1 OsmC family protein [Bacillus aquiflavi]